MSAGEATQDLLAIEGQLRRVVEVSPDQLQVGDRVAAFSDASPDNIVEGEVISVPERSQDDSQTAPRYVGSVLLRSLKTEIQQYPPWHPRAGQTEEQPKPTIALPLEPYNNQNYRETNARRASMPEHTSYRYRFFRFVPE